MELQQFYICVFLIVAITVSVDTQANVMYATSNFENANFDKEIKTICLRQSAAAVQLKQCLENWNFVLKLVSVAKVIGNLTSSLSASHPGLSRADILHQLAAEVASAELHIFLKGLKRLINIPLD